MKIKITCTKEEKEQWNYSSEQLKEIICTLRLRCPRGLSGGCGECVEKTIEWEVTDDE